MLYRGHIAASTVISLPILAYTGHLTTIVTGAVLLGSLLPDVDEENSFIGRKVPAISFTINKIFGHRGLTHSLIALIILFSISTYTGSFILGGLTLGYFLHLFEDYFSDAGIMWLQPFTKKEFRVPKHLRYLVGGVKEHIIFGICILLILLDINKIFNFHIVIPIVTTIFNIAWNMTGSIGLLIFRAI